MPIWVRQAGAIPTIGNKVCMVSSRSGRRWVLPKGQIEPGQTSGETALNEAWEEAGLVGSLENEPVGAYCYEKLGRDHHVVVYRLHVTEARAQWPERTVRDRVWVSVEDALERIEEPGLRDIVRAVFGRKDFEEDALREDCLPV